MLWDIAGDIDRHAPDEILGTIAGDDHHLGLFPGKDTTETDHECPHAIY
jgi:arginine repressor